MQEANMGREDDPIFLLDTKSFNREMISRGYTAGESAIMRKTRRTLRNRQVPKLKQASSRNTNDRSTDTTNAPLEHKRKQRISMRTAIGVNGKQGKMY